MEALNQLRRAARAKRDKTIAQAREDYVATLARIAELDLALYGKPSLKTRSAAACIERIMPVDAPFTIVDIVAGLEALDAGRPWSRRAIDTHVAVLLKRGLIRRLRRGCSGSPAVYIRAGSERDDYLFAGMKLVDVVALMLAGGPMTPVEIVVALKEAGYRTTRTDKALQWALPTELKKDRRFEVKGGKWGLA